MVRDYGGLRFRRIHGFMLAVAVLSTVAVAAFYGYAYLRDQGKAKARAESFDFAGAQCEALGPADMAARRLKIRNKFLYEEIEFGRAVGHADCAALKTGFLGLSTVPACQFTSPAALVVTTRKGEFFYVPQAGQPATVVVHDGVPKCVLGGKFTLTNGG